MKFAAMVLLLLIVTATAWAEPITASVKYDAPGDVFRAGQWEATAGATVLFSPFVATRNRPAADYALGALDFGYMITDVKEWGIARGNFEILGELFGGGVFVGRGNYVGGFTAWFRYNFVQPDWKLVPYAQVGAGLGATDLDRRLIGQNFEFNVDAAVGLRYFIRPKLALIGEYRFQHMSNANCDHRNIGINAQGPFVGVSCFF